LLLLLFVWKNLVTFGGLKSKEENTFTHSVVVAVALSDSLLFDMYYN